MAVDHPKIVIVGCGPGGQEYITPAARAAVDSAEIVLGSRRLLRLFSDRGGRQVALPAEVEPALQIIAEHYGRHRPAVLVSGDPGLFSLAKAVVARFGRSNCEVIPAVSSLQAAFARLGLDWSDVRIVSAHGRVPQVSAGELSRSHTIAVFAGTPQAVDWARLVAEELAASHRLFACEDLTLPDEHVREVPPRELLSASLSSLSLLVLVRRDDLAEEPPASDSRGA